MVFLTGLLPASCHKTAPEPQKTPAPTNTVAVQVQSTNTVRSSIRDLGQISLVNHAETTLHLVTGEDILMTPKVQDGKTVQITLSLESKNDYGETHNFAVTQVTAEIGKPVQVALGELKLTFTPLVAEGE
jgi:hypothetical protein